MITVSLDEQVRISQTKEGGEGLPIKGNSKKEQKYGAENSTGHEG